MFDEFLEVGKMVQPGNGFRPETLQSFDWEYPIWLYIMPFVPLLLIFSGGCSIINFARSYPLHFLITN